jgi:hypothetical protein
MTDVTDVTVCPVPPYARARVGVIRKIGHIGHIGNAQASDSRFRKVSCARAGALETVQPAAVIGAHPSMYGPKND